MSIANGGVQDHLQLGRGITTRKCILIHRESPNKKDPFTTRSPVSEAPLVGLLSIGWLWRWEDESISQISKHPPVTIWAQEGPGGPTRAQEGPCSTNRDFDGFWWFVAGMLQILLCEASYSRTSGTHSSSISKQESGNQHGIKQWLMSQFSNASN